MDVLTAWRAKYYFQHLVCDLSTSSVKVVDEGNMPIQGWCRAINFNVRALKFTSKPHSVPVARENRDEWTICQSKRLLC